MLFSQKCAIATLASAASLPQAAAFFGWFRRHDNDGAEETSEMTNAVYTGQGKFLWSYDSSGNGGFTLDRGNTIRMVDNKFDGEAVATAGVWHGEYMDLNVDPVVTDTGFKLSAASSAFSSNIYFMCPFLETTPTVSFRCASDLTGTNPFTNTSFLDNIGFEIDGPMVKTFEVGGDFNDDWFFAGGVCPTSPGFSSEPFLVFDIECTPNNVEDFPAMKAIVEAGKSYGTDPGVRENIGVILDAAINSAWFAVDNLDGYFLEGIKYDEGSDAGSCTGAMCMGHYVSAVVHSDDSSSVRLTSDHWDFLIILCPWGDQSVNLTDVTCLDGATEGVTFSTDPYTFGPILENPALRGCDDDVYTGTVVCTNP